MKYKYLVYSGFNKTNKNVFDTAREALKWSKENLTEHFSFYKYKGETWDDVFAADLVTIGRGKKVAKIWKNDELNYR